PPPISIVAGAAIVAITSPSPKQCSSSFCSCPSGSKARTGMEGTLRRPVDSRRTDLRMSILLETKGLTKEFPAFVPFPAVDLAVRPGAIHALIGPNRAGKTPVFNLLTKFLKPTAGRIFYDGRDVTSLAPAAIARMGVVRSFQISATFPQMTALENVRVTL